MNIILNIKACVLVIFIFKDAITDIIFLLSMFALAITCAIKEYELQSFQLSHFFSLYYNYGAYASASVSYFI